MRPKHQNSDTSLAASWHRDRCMLLFFFFRCISQRVALRIEYENVGTMVMYHDEQSLLKLCD